MCPNCKTYGGREIEPLRLGVTAQEIDDVAQERNVDAEVDPQHQAEGQTQHQGEAGRGEQTEEDGSPLIHGQAHTEVVPGPGPVPGGQDEVRRAESLGKALVKPNRRR